MDDSITFLGVRGSAPANGEEFEAYGKHTSCYLVTLDGTAVMVDCGTGVQRAGAVLDELPELHLLISHSHLDHIAGLFQLIPMMKQKPLHIYGNTFNGLTIEEQIKRLVGPPIWPVYPETMDREVHYHEIGPGPFSIGPITVRTMKSNHPGGCTLYRLDGSRHSAVIASDFNHNGGADRELIGFSRNTDLIIYDGSLTKADYESCSEWGHSTAEMGAEIAQKAGVGAIAISHHSPFATDQDLDVREHEFRERYPNLFFAYGGLRFVLGGRIPGFCNSGKDSGQLDKLRSLINISVRMNSEKNRTKLFEHIIRSAMEITRADGGTLYTLERDERLHFRIMINKSLGIFKGGANDPIHLPPVPLSPTNVCAAAALSGNIINIEDVCSSGQYDFSGPRKYDAMTGYRTRSVMVVPMEDISGEVIGVLQLINALDQAGRLISFTVQDEEMVNAIASQAGVCISNIAHEKNVTELLNGFVRGISEGLDARTPYNANHSRNMAEYCAAFLDYEEQTDGPYAMDENGRQELLMSVWLHDIGKLATPIDVMDKAQRLTDSHFEKMTGRYYRRELILMLESAKGMMTETEMEARKKELWEEYEFLLKVNRAGYLGDDMIRRVREIASSEYREADGSMKPKLTKEESRELMIRKGTLTEEERKIMQDHVVYTSRMLGALNFPKNFRHVASWAGTHHEFLDGSGYPNHLTAESLSWPARLITILDIFEALTAADRPYRDSMNVERALQILKEMVSEGKLDGNILQEYEKSEAWKNAKKTKKCSENEGIGDWITRK